MPTDSIPVFDAISRVTDAEGNPVSGGALEFYAAGTSTPRTVYADAALTVSLGSVVSTNAGGYPVTGAGVQTLIYTGTGAYKVVVKNALGATIITHDNVRGATATSDDADAALPKTPVIHRASDYTFAIADRAKLISANATSSGVTMTLPSAVLVGDGWRGGVQHAAGNNTVTVRTVGGQTVTRPGHTTQTSMVLSGTGETAWFVSDGANWRVDTYVPPLMTPNIPFTRIVERRPAAPGAPYPGARYIATADGVWGTLPVSANAIVESDGIGGWISYTPQSGWAAWSNAEALLYVYSSSWVAWTDVTTPTSVPTRVSIFEHQESNGSGGGSGTNNAYTARTLNTDVSRTPIPGVSLSGTTAINLPVGTFLVFCQQSFSITADGSGTGSTMEARQRLQAGTAVLSAAPLPGLPGHLGGTWSSSGLTLDFKSTHVASDVYAITVTTAGTVALQYFKTAGTLGNVSGEPSSAVEVYARVTIIDLAGLRGPQGLQGVMGPGGLTTVVSSPGAGIVADLLQPSLSAASPLSAATAVDAMRRRVVPSFMWTPRVLPSIVRAPGDVVCDRSGLAAWISTYPSVFNGNVNTAWVETTGDDGTGALNNPSLPYRSIQPAITAGADLVLVGPGTFEPFSVRHDQHPLSRAPLVMARVRGASTLRTTGNPLATRSWTATSGTTNVWQTTIDYAAAPMVYKVWRTDVRDAEGFPQRLTKRASVAALESATSGWFFDAAADVLYVAIGGGSVEAAKASLVGLFGRAADSYSTRIFVYGKPFALDGFVLDGIQIFALEYNDGGSYLRSDVCVSQCTLFAANDHAVYTLGSNSIVDRCRIHASTNDGGNYNVGAGSFQPLSIEMGNFVTRAGDPATEAPGFGNRNGSSSHSTFVYRYGCVLEKSFGPDVADTSVSGLYAGTWMVGCVARQGDPANDNPAGILIQGLNTSGDIGNRRAWLDTCYAGQEPLNQALVIDRNAVVKTFACTFDAAPVLTGGASAPVAYVPETP